MRKDVKRSLLLWPAAASVAITAMTWMQESRDSRGIDLASLSRIAPKPWASGPPIEYDWSLTQTWNSDEWQRRWPNTSSGTAADVSFATENGPRLATSAERTTDGRRALKLPTRLQGVLLPGNSLHIPQSGADKLASAKTTNPISEASGTAPFVLRAPNRPVGEELAGTFAIPASSRYADASKLLDELLSSVDAATIDPQSGDDSVFLLTPAQSADTSAARRQEFTDASIRAAIPQSVAALGRPKTPVAVNPPKSALPAFKPTGFLSAAASATRRSSVTQTESTPKIVLSSGPATSAVRRMSQSRPGTWPVTPGLDSQLKQLEAIRTASDRSPQILVSSSTAAFESANWAADVATKLNELQSLQRLSDSNAGRIIGDLRRLSVAGKQSAESCTDRREQLEWLRAAHSLTRRVAVWAPVAQIVGLTDQSGVDTDSPAEHRHTLVIQPVRSDLAETGDVDGWNAYLMLDEVARAATTNSVEQRAFVARRLLSRLEWHELSPVHREWLDRDSVSQLRDFVKPWATTAVDYADLLAQLEQQEASSLNRASTRIAGTVQALRFAESNSAVQVGRALNSYYRNANVRVAISEQMLSRVLPTVETKSVPVRANVLGSRVTGTSHVNTSIALELTPTPNRWAINLLTDGTVQTNSVGRKGPVAVRTAGTSIFSSVTPIKIDHNGILVDQPSTEVRGGSRLRGVRSDYDGWPLVGPLVRSFAEAKFAEMQPRSNRIANQRVRGQVGSQLTSQVDTRATTAATNFSKIVLGPLSEMKLNPQVIDMQTTAERLLARYRIAGDWQLAAATPRPRAPGDSLMSLQVHETAINNTIEQVVPKEDAISIADMVRNAMETFGKDPSELVLPQDIPEDVMVKFASVRPITVEMSEGKMWLTLQIVRLTKGKQLDLSRFIVKAAYVPKVDGLEASLVREGHLRVSGPGMSMRQRLPIRAIFNKVLSAERKFPLTLPQLTEHAAAEGLAVSQLELRDGWVGLAISEKRADQERVAVMGMQLR